MQDPGSLASLVIPRVVFDGAYGHPAGGTPGSLHRITRGDLMAQYARLYRPDNAVLVLTGDIDPEAGFALAAQAFGAWTRPPGAPPADPVVRPGNGRRIVVVDLPDAGQAAVVAAGPSVTRNDPSFHAVQVADSVLGGGYSARLNEEIRVRRGLSYDARSQIEARRGLGLFTASAQTKNPSADEVAGLLLDEVARLGQAPPPAAELEARKATLVGEFGRDAATSSGLGATLSFYADEGVNPNEVARYIPGVQAVSSESEQAAAAKVVDPATADLVVVGDAKLFLPALGKRFGAVDVIPADKLDLDSPDLGGTAR
jgi:zinc protease